MNQSQIREKIARLETELEQTQNNNDGSCEWVDYVRDLYVRIT